jgi:hypothetical protein
MAISFIIDAPLSSFAYYPSRRRRAMPLAY